MTDEEFRAKRRQIYLDGESYINTITHEELALGRISNGLNSPNQSVKERSVGLDLYADSLWFVFQLRYTAGEDLTVLAESLTGIVQAYERYAEELLKLPDDDYRPPFILDDMIDTYVDYVNLLSAAILLHREDLIPRIYGLIEGTDFDGQDLVIEELLIPFIEDRPDIDEWYWDKQYRPLLEAKFAETPQERSKLMQKYVKNWYKNMKGEAHFWGGHELIKPEFSPYEGYWAMCAAAFSYLFDIDDSSYRDQIVYPKDLVDYARSKPRRTVDEAQKLVPQELRRCEGGKPCPAAGYWFTPASANSRRLFKQGEVMPKTESDYGDMIWYWSPQQG